MVTVSGNKGNAFQVLATVSSHNLLREPGRALSWNLSSRKIRTSQHSIYSLSLVKPRIQSTNIEGRGINFWRKGFKIFSSLISTFLNQVSVHFKACLKHFLVLNNHFNILPILSFSFQCCFPVASLFLWLPLDLPSHPKPDLWKPWER